MEKIISFYKPYITINGKEFSWTSISVENGNRLVVDNINGLYRPVIQYLGTKETRFNITIKYGGISIGKTTSEVRQISNENFNFYSQENTASITTESGVEASYFNQKAFLKDILETPKSKFVEIVFPDGDLYYGILENNSINMELSMLGGNTHQLTFIALRPAISSTYQGSGELVKSTKTTINSFLSNELKQDNMLDKMKNYFNNKDFNRFSNMITKIANIYKSYRKYANILKSYIAEISGFLTKVQANIDSFISVVQEPSKILTMLTQINRQVVEIAKTPDKIVGAVQDIVDGVKLYFNNTKNTFKFLIQMFDFSKSTNDKLAEYYNLNKLQKDIMNNELKNTTNIILCTNAIENIIDIKFDSNEELIEYQENITTIYENLIEDNTINDDVKNLLFIQYNEAKIILENKDIANKNIQNIEIKTPSTLSQVVFQLYGNLDNYDNIFKLNEKNIKDVMNIQGILKII